MFLKVEKVVHSQEQIVLQNQRFFGVDPWASRRPRPVTGQPSRLTGLHWLRMLRLLLTGTRSIPLLQELLTRTFSPLSPFFTTWGVGWGCRCSSPSTRLLLLLLLLLLARLWRCSCRSLMLVRSTGCSCLPLGNLSQSPVIPFVSHLVSVTLSCRLLLLLLLGLLLSRLLWLLLLLTRASVLGRQRDDLPGGGVLLDPDRPNHGSSRHHDSHTLLTNGNIVDWTGTATSSDLHVQDVVLIACGRRGIFAGCASGACATSATNRTRSHVHLLLVPVRPSWLLGRLRLTSTGRRRWSVENRLSLMSSGWHVITPSNMGGRRGRNRRGWLNQVSRHRVELALDLLLISIVVIDVMPPLTGRGQKNRSRSGVRANGTSLLLLLRLLRRLGSGCRPGRTRRWSPGGGGGVGPGSGSRSRVSYILSSSDFFEGL